MSSVKLCSFVEVSQFTVRLVKRNSFAAVVWLLFMATSHLHAGVIVTPAGLNPGDNFRIVFVTNGTTNANNPTMAYYDNFVTQQANGATYNGAAVSWKAIVTSSDPLIYAKDHIQTSATLAGIFRADGTKVAAAMPDFWGGTLMAAINLTLENTTPTGTNFVHTGTSQVGEPFWSLGNSDGFARYGDFTRSDQGWISHGNIGSGAQHHIYGISEVLTATAALPPVPEPTSFAIFIALGCIVGRTRWRRQNPSM